MPSMAIVGTERCGKTVLVTTLAMRLQSPDGRGVFIEPVNRKTKTYVERSWRKLSDCDWPPVTAPGELNELEWRLHAGNDVQCDVKLVDCAGHDLRALFADEQVKEFEKLPDALKDVANYCREADIVLFVANLKDFLIEDNTDRLVANQWAVKFGMDHVRRNGQHRHCCLLFTQVDVYQHVSQECGDWMSVAKKYMPDVYAAHLHRAEVPLFPVAAVAETIERQNGGKRFVVPAVGFSSKGLEPFVQWLADAARDVVARRAAQEAESRRQEHERKRQEQEQKQLEAARQEQRRLQEEQNRIKQEMARQRERLKQMILHVGPWGLLAAVLVFLVSFKLFLFAGQQIQPIVEEHKEFQDLVQVSFYKDEDIYVTRSSGMWWWYKEWQEKTGTRLALIRTEYFTPGTAPKADGKYVVHDAIKRVDKQGNVVTGMRNLWLWGGALPLMVSLGAGLGVSWYMWGRRARAFS